MSCSVSVLRRARKKPAPVAPAGRAAAADGSGNAARAATARRRRHPAPPAPPALTEDEIFARKTLEQLNAERPLGDVFFDLDESTVRDDARAPLQKNAEWMKRWTSTRITVEGHCDERGSGEYNLALGRSARQRGQGLPGEPRHRRRSRRGRQQGQGIAVLHRVERSVLAAEPARALRHHGEVSSHRAARHRQPQAPQSSLFASCRVRFEHLVLVPLRSVSKSRSVIWPRATFRPHPSAAPESRGDSARRASGRRVMSISSRTKPKSGCSSSSSARAPRTGDSPGLEYSVSVRSLGLPARPIRVRACDLGGHLPGGCPRIRCRGDRPANHQVRRAGRDRLRAGPSVRAWSSAAGSTRSAAGCRA